jgi:Flp pilus assembly protein TadD
MVPRLADGKIDPRRWEQWGRKEDPRLWGAHVQMGGKNYDDVLRGLTGFVPSTFDEREYLVHYTIGRAAEERGDKRVWDGAVNTVGAIRERAPNDKDCKLAKTSFRKSIELNPGFSPAYQQLAECLEREGRFAEALTLADLLVMRVPRCATAYKLRGGLHTELNRNLDALADFETAAELGPNDPETYFEIGQVCLPLGENAKAVIAYELAIRLKSRYAPGCHHNMGLAYERMGKFEQALACYEKAKSLGFWPEVCNQSIARCRAQLK